MRPGGRHKSRGQDAAIVVRAENNGWQAGRLPRLSQTIPDKKVGDP